MVWLPCPYLGREVELTPERERHIVERHSRVLSSVRRTVADVLADPDEIRRRTWRPSELIFLKRRQESDIVLVMTVTDDPLDDERPPRTWVVTAFPASSVPASAILWSKL